MPHTVFIQFRTGSFSQNNEAREGKKDIQIVGEEVKVFLFVDDIILYITKDSIKTQLELITPPLKKERREK
jgi:hypothetical protein